MVMEKLFAKSKVPIIPLRIEPSEKAEMVSQVLFGEYVEIVSEIDGWTEVSLVADGYTGWLDSKMIAINKSVTKLFPQSFAKVCSSFMLAKAVDTGDTIHLTSGSVLNNYSEEKGTFKALGIEYEVLIGRVLQADSFLSMEAFLDLSKAFLNAPYLWGGRSIFGVDCSGFVQVLYSLLGVQLPRDSSDMVMKGEPVTFVQHVLPGDLAFFGKEEDSITHVGMVLDKNTIIHASGKVRIDTLDSEGIFNNETKEYTHLLRAIKRLLPIKQID